MNKQHFLRLIGNDHLDEVITELHNYAVRYHLPELQSDTVIQSGLLEACKKAGRAGITAFEILAQQRAAVRQNLLDIVNELPEQPPAPPKQKPGFSERRFKITLFWCMLIGKLGVIAWLSVEVDTGGFAPGEFTSTISMLLPVFTAYLTPMFAELLKKRHLSALPQSQLEKRIGGVIPILTFAVLLPLYFFLMIHFIQNRGSGIYSFERMTSSLMLLETAIGVYIGMIVSSVFEPS